MAGKRVWRCVLAALTISLLQAAPAGASIPLPDEIRPVMDQAGLLSAPVEARLASRLEQVHAATGSRLSVLTVESTGGEPIDVYVRHLLGYWQVERSTDPGALLVVAWRERAITLVEIGATGRLAAPRLRAIVSDVITPEFRRNAFDRGVEAGVEALIAELQEGAVTRVEGHDRPAPEQSTATERPRSGPDTLPILMAGLGCALLAGALRIRAGPGRGRAEVAAVASALPRLLAGRPPG